MSINKSYEKINHDVSINKSSQIEYNKKMAENADALDTFGGKRLLGLTKNNVPIYVKYVIDRETLTVDISLTHTMDVIRKSELCPRGVYLGLNESINLDHAMRPKTKKDHSEVTQRTLDYLEKIMEKNSINYYKVNKKTTSLMFMYISNSIYPGNTDKCRWRDIVQVWKLPKGKYFIID
jgi:hypothetical protein|tara:strand:+ start:591 stop:1127 length:537 start_codon:yes stop_codon:yes gene_type:complete